MNVIVKNKHLWILLLCFITICFSKITLRVFDLLYGDGDGQVAAFHLSRILTEMLYGLAVMLIVALVCRFWPSGLVCFRHTYIRLLGRLALISFSLLVTLIILELILQGINYPRPMWSPFIRHHDAGVIYAPNRDEQHIQPPEINVRFTSNSYGFRDKEPAERAGSLGATDRTREQTEVDEDLRRLEKLREFSPVPLANCYEQVETTRLQKPSGPPASLARKIAYKLRSLAG